MALWITEQVVLDDNELEFDYVRASGPGGQNVNKVSTAVKLRFDVEHSPSLPEDIRHRLIRLAGKRVSEQGVLTIDARRFRTQDRNRQDAVDRFKGWPHSGHITLARGERSRLADFASEVL